MAMLKAFKQFETEAQEQYKTKRECAYIQMAEVCKDKKEEQVEMRVII